MLVADDLQRAQRMEAPEGEDERLPAVGSMTLEDLERAMIEKSLGAHARNVTKVVVDAEGYDAEIIRAIDFDRHRPTLLVYEHYHLDAATRSATRSTVEAAGYTTIEEGFDTICVSGMRVGRLKPLVPGVARYEEGA